MEKKKTNLPTLYVIDGNSLFYKAFYALPETMKTSSGIVTNAVYGFTVMLLRLLDDNPDYVAVAFDVGRPTFRHKEYDAYKAKRQKAPDTLKKQIPIVKEIIADMRIPIFETEGFEADDLIGTIAKRAEKNKITTYIVTADKDALQLVTPEIKALLTLKGISDTAILGEKEVEKKMGVPPKYVADYKALRGDPSDNIPGVPGIGDKTAVSLIREFGPLENILANLDKIKSKSTKEKISRNIELARVSKRLATIVVDVPIDVDFETIKRKPIDWDKMLLSFEKYEFTSLIKKYGAVNAPGLFAKISSEKVHHQDDDENYVLIDDEEKYGNLLEKLKSSTAFAFDTETTSLDTLEAQLVGISFSEKTGDAYYLPQKVISSHPVLTEKLKAIFSGKSIKKYGHNIKYDMEVLLNQGINVNGIAFDSMVAAYLLDSEGGSFGLKYLGAKYFGKSMTTFDELIAADEIMSIADAPPQDVSRYACADADITFRLAEVLSGELKEKGVYDVFSNVEVPLIEVLVYLERNGVSIDVPKLKEISIDLKQRLSRLETEIHCICGEAFNINSPKQLGEILFKKLKLPVTKRTKTGPSTDSSVLESLAPNFEVASKLMDYRQISKLLSTYVDVLPDLVNKRTNRLHTSFNQVVTATGRLSSSNPNLQNIPIKTTYGQAIREAFIPAKNEDFILCADYSQIELRILAHLSEDSVLINDFNKGVDIHSATAAEIHGVDISSVTKEMRNFAKTINFGVVYGMSSFGLAKTLGIKKNEAQDYIDKYFAKYSGVKAYMDSLIKFAQKNGYVATLLGRRRYLANINSHNLNERMFAERTAINTPVQGTAADLIKVAMIKIYEEIKSRKLKSKMILQIHDELLFECPGDEIEVMKNLVSDIMSGAVPLNVPVKVDIGVGKSWGEAKG